MRPTPGCVGTPFNVSTGTDTANTAASGTYRPNILKPATSNCGRGHLIGCIDATAFTVADLYPIVPTNFAYGNAGRNLLRGPASQTVNLSVFKNFQFSESKRLQFRFSGYNFLNHPLYSFGHDNNLNLALDANGKLSNSNFGYATNKVGRRIIQLAIKFYF